MKPRITYANVTATLALFVALGGSAYAVNSVNGKDVVNGSLTGKDIKNNSLKAVDIKGLAANTVVRQGTPSTSQVAAGSTAQCKAGETLLSGGFSTAGGSILPSTIANQPTAVNNGKTIVWESIVALNPPNSGSVTITPYALCAS